MRGGRHRVLDLAHAEPPHGDGRPDAVAAGRRRRARGHRARASRTPGHGVVELISDFSPDAEGEFAHGARGWCERPGGRCRSRWRRATASPRRGAICSGMIEAARRPTGCRSGPRSRPARRGAARPAVLVSTRSRASPRTRARSRVGRSPSRCARCATRRSGPACSGATRPRRAARRRLVDYARIFPLGDLPDYEPTPETSIAALAAARGVDPAELALDLLLEDDGRALPLSPVLQLRRRQSRRLRRDAGPPRHRLRAGRRRRARRHHLRRELPDLFLSHWGRDRCHGRMPVGGVVEQLTSRHGPGGRPARPRRARAGHAGRPQRHRLRPPALRARRRWPTTSRRRQAAAAAGPRATRATVVSRARSPYRDGEPTGALPGRLVRGRAA